MEIVGREASALVLQLPTGGADRLGVKHHMRLFWRAPALFEIAGGTGRGHIFPCRAAALRPRDHMIERQVFQAAAILALEPVTQEEVETGKGRMLRWPDILLQRNHRRELHCEIAAVDFALIFFDDIHPVQKHGLDRCLPWPERKRVIAQGRVVRIEHKCRAAVRMAD